MFQKATKKKAKLRLALVGPAKAGKTRTALSIAKHLGSRIAVIDTERGSASKYAGEVAEFDVVELSTYAPGKFLEAMRAAAQSYDVLVIDSLSHAWMGEGGILDQKDRKGGNSFDAWRTLTPQHNELVDAILGWPGHLIATMRAKMAYEVTKDSNGKTKVEKLGLAPVQRDGMEYEFDVLADIDHDHTIHIGSSRCSALDGVSIRKPTGEEIAKTLLTWLDDGAEAPKRAPAVNGAPRAGVKDTKTPDELREWCASNAKTVAENGPRGLAKVVAHAATFGVSEHVVRQWLGMEPATPTELPDGTLSADPPG